MINLYIFNEKSKAAVFGIGTYIRELTAALKGSNINVCVVHLSSERQEMEIEELEGVRYWFFPAPTTFHFHQKQEHYYRNVLYLLQMYIVDRKNLIFQINYLHCKSLVEFLRASFECKIVLVIHYLESINTLLGNISRFRRIISQPNVLTDEIEIMAKLSFLKEKELLQSPSIDKIICLSNHAFDLLHQDYQIDKEKMDVIYRMFPSFFSLEDCRKLRD